MDFTNWDVERQKLKDEIFKELREQRDRKGEISTSGTIVINPQDTTTVFGPFLFKTNFLSSPDIEFNQILADPDNPYVVLPYTNRWSASQGSVEGFYLGVYALTAPPAGVFKHTITWKATGKAQVYRNESKLEAWRLGYDEAKADHLHGTSY